MTPLSAQGTTRFPSVRMHVTPDVRGREAATSSGPPRPQIVNDLPNMFPPI